VLDEEVQELEGLHDTGGAQSRQPLARGAHGPAMRSIGAAARLTLKIWRQFFPE